MFTISGVENIKIVQGREAKSLKNGKPTFPGVQYQSVSFGRPHKQTNKLIGENLGRRTSINP